MGLKVWLPLNGDLRNLGCSNCEVTTIETTPIYVDGKIGQCYQRTNSSTQSTNGISINSNLLDMLGTAATVALWVKPLGTHTHYEGAFISSGDWNAKRWAFGVNQNNTQVDVLCGSYRQYIDCTVPVNQWTHLVSTYDNGLCKLYKNGIYIGELAGRAAFDSDATNTCIGRETYANGYFGFNGLINDVRIYDHCLSAAEIHEIAKGVVLHYRLDGPIGGSNFNLGNYSRLLNGALASVTNSNWSKRGASTLVLSDNINKVNCTAAWQGFSLYVNNLNLQVGTNYTISCYGYTNSTDNTNAGISFYPMIYDSSGTRDTTSKMPISVMGGPFTDANAKIIGLLNTSVVLYYATFTWNQTMKNIIDNGGKIELTIQIHGTFPSGRIDTLYLPQLEIGNSPTNRIPSYFDLGIDTTIVTDSSGYGYNGEIIDTINFISDSPRYDTSINLIDNTSGVTITQMPMNIFNNGNTIAFWIKPSGENGQRSVYCSSYGGNSYSIEKTSNNKLRIWWAGSPDVRSSELTINDNEWQHIAIVKTEDKQNLLLYKNGEYVETLTNTFPDKEWSGIYRLGRDNRTDDTAYKGQMSDFRIYCTPLLDTDIKLLYNTNSRIDNLGEIHTYKLQESTTRELLQGIHITSGYTVHSSLSNPYTLYSNGEIYFNTKIGIGSDYIPISPSGHTYYYDFDISVNAGNQLYIGFERYDADKTSRSNNACVYIWATKPTTDVSHRHFFGTVNLATDGVNPCAFIALRILNGWSGTNSDVTGIATIHRMSLREVSTIQSPKIYSNGILLTDEFKEYQNPKFYKNGIIEATEFIEI